MIKPALILDILLQRRVLLQGSALLQYNVIALKTADNSSFQNERERRPKDGLRKRYTSLLLNRLHLFDSFLEYNHRGGPNIDLMSEH